MPAKQKAAGLAPSPLDAWDAPEDTTMLPLSTGRVVEVRPLDLTGALVMGLLPDQVIHWEIFRDLDDPAGKKTFQDRVKLIYESKLMCVARGLVTPKLALGPPNDLLSITPRKEKGEIGPRQLKPREIDEIYNFLLYGVLPEVSTAPFPTDESGSEGDEPAVSSGADVPPEPEPAAAPGDGQ